MKDMKKIVAPLLVGAVALVTPVASHAFTSLSVLSSTASVTVTGGTASLALAIKNISNNTAATAISWTAAAGQGWTLANQYVQLNTTLSTSGSGVQTYTNNAVAGANPRYTGLISSYTQTPAGLVSESTTTQVIPTAWEVTASTAGVNGAVDPGTGSISPNSYAWFYHEDHSQVAVPSSNAGAFTNADPFITVVGAGNQIHYGQGPTQFGGPVPQSYVYLEANFTSALGGVTYQTSALTFELFTQ
jgi:hypothetical protein